MSRKVKSNTGAQPKTVRVRGRADFVLEKVEAKETPGEFRVVLKPDPRRYEKLEKDGETRYLDRFLKLIFRLEDFVEQMSGVPIFHLEPHIDGAIPYADSRREAIDSELGSGIYVPPTEGALPHRPLSDPCDVREIGFLSLDICGATALRHLEPDAFDRACEIVLRELATVVGQFNGTILKIKGDGLIALIDHPSFNSACDALVDMGLTMRHVLRSAVNPALVVRGLTPLDVRIGAEYGDARVTEFKVPLTGYVTRDVVSDALNRAVKIEESCARNEFRIGQALYELIHVQWLERATEVAFEGEIVGMPGYHVYKVD